MKNVCSLKTIAVLFLVLFAFMGLNKAYAGPLNEREEIMLGTYLTDESARPAIRMEYWAKMKYDIAEMQQALPVQLSENVWMVMMSYDGLKDITYSYYTDNSGLLVADVKESITEFTCQDPQVILLLSTMEGTMNYEYYLYPNNEEVWQSFTFSAKDCGPGV